MKSSLQQGIAPCSELFTTNPLYSIWWIDAISINQRDAEERERQVALMRRIYTRVGFVYAYLGQEQDGSDLAMDLINWYSKLKFRSKKTFRRLADPQFAVHWTALEKVLERSYWRRCWIVPELVVNEKCVLICGSREGCFPSVFRLVLDIVRPTHSSTIKPFWKRISSHIKYTVSPEKAQYQPNLLPNTVVARRAALIEQAAPIIAIADIGYGKLLTTRDNILNILIQFRSCLATDTRDKIYSFLGLVDGLDFQVSYAVS
ncbi:MAG: hypothetical protein MMC33_005713 [Icmadophila ericetorum]|nr:hypothetical protein [Icmadophila ericetorum]